MGIGIWQVLIILVIVLVIFGGGKLAKSMGDLGSGIRNFKKGLNGEDEAEGTTTERKPAEPEKIEKQDNSARVIDVEAEASNAEPKKNQDEKQS